MNCSKCGVPIVTGCPQCFYTNSGGDIEKDAARWRWWVANGMQVTREEDWTCWVTLPCVPYRAKTSDPGELTDQLMARFPIVKETL